MPSIVTVGNDTEPKQDNPASLPTTQPLANSSLTAKPTPKPPVTMREFGDADATRNLIYNNVLEAAKQIQPVSNNRYTLSLHEPHWGEEANYSIADRKRAILRGETMQRRMKGTWRLTDNEGKLVGERTSTIAHVPHLTNQGTFVINGSEYTLGHQMRLQPGIFARRKENGEIESHINILPGKGLSHHYFLEPETGVFKMKIAQANLPLISVLKTMGVSDKELRDAWGNELYNANLAKDDPRVVDKLYDKLIGRKGKADATSAEKAEAVGRTLQAMELNPEVTKRTLGQAFPKLSKEAALATSKKLLAISRGEADTDDRDHLAFQNFLGPEDLFAERMGRDKRVLNEVLWKATTKGDIHAVPTGVFTPHVHAALLDSGLGQALEEINSSDVLDQQTRVSRLGYGGIPSIDAVPDEARSVQPSHIGFIDLLRTPESFKVGVDSRVSAAARKGSDGRIYTPFIDAKSGQHVYKSPQDIADLTVAFPGEMERGKATVRAQVAGKTRTVPKSQVDLVMPHAEHWFSPINNLVPLKSSVKGQRAAMASRFITQALPLDKAESPYVRGQVPGSPGRSFEEHYGQHMGAVRAKDVGGRVESVTPEGITVKYADGTSQTHELYNNFPYNRKTFQHNTAMVKPGDPIKPGQLLAKSNYTDDQGHVALGKNFRVAYMPFRGANYEDAYVISEAAAKRLSSEHMYQHNLEWEDKHRRGKYPFISLFPGTFNKQQFKNIDKDGVIAPGTVIQPGDPLILAAKERELSKKQVHTAHRGSFSNESLTWDHHSPGIVTDVEKTNKGVTVAVKTLNKSQVGDKISGRYGDKGVISMVVPDHEMPQDEQGRPFEILANPLGVISRTNPAQYFEAAMGKIAEKTGKPQIINDFSEIPDLEAHVEKQLTEHGLKGTEKVTDPITGQVVHDPVTDSHPFTGNRFFMKLHHTSESKGQGRGLGSYTAEGLPAKGGAEGSKRVSLMDINALLSHGAIETLRDAKLIRGQKNQEYWSSFMAGHRPPTPSVPMVYEKFVNQLRASGINVTRDGYKTNIMELTNKDVNGLAGERELQSAKTVDWDTGLAPIPGGLFDEGLTGGHNGKRWAKITLAEPLPNPVMEEPIRRLLGLTKNKFEEIIAGTAPFNGSTGPSAIAKGLAAIDLPKATAQAIADMKSGKRTVRDEAVRKFFYLRSAELKGVHPKDWVMNAVPVLPPMFRPISIMQGSGRRMVGDANHLYKEVFDANDALKKVQGVSEDTGQARMDLYNAFRAVTGLGDPIHPKNRERGVKGMLAQIKSTSPKHGTVQQKLLGTTVDLVGRAVVVPNPDLNMDQVGLPENRAWEVYTPFIVRRLVRKGVSRMRALEYVQNRNELAKKTMLEEIGERPVVVTRAPVLHRYGLMAFWPKLTKGDTLQISPLVVGGFGMDFDGDTSNYHVPASDEARDEAVHKMMPSKNLLSVQKFQAHWLPRQEYVSGLFSATAKKNENKAPRVFATKSDALKAFHRGEIAPNHPIHIVHDDR